MAFIGLIPEKEIAVLESTFTFDGKSELIEGKLQHLMELVLSHHSSCYVGVQSLQGKVLSHSATTTVNTKDVSNIILTVTAAAILKGKRSIPIQ